MHRILIDIPEWVHFIFCIQGEKTHSQAFEWMWMNANGSEWMGMAENVRIAFPPWVFSYLWKSKIFVLKSIVILNKWSFCRHVFMNIKLEHASVIDKKISSFARAVMKIINFLSAKWLLRHSVYCFFPICEKVKFFCWGQ